ncbi:MAG: DUF4868 domain-containing protein [Dehalococcoidia bacterium]|nr:DUF4868 domain-containing protein [Dehalococcoidia bacterium]
MNLDVDLDQIQTTEFGVGMYQGGSREFAVIPANDAIQTLLLEIVRDTVQGIDNTLTPPEYDPANEYPPKEYVALAIDHEFALPIAEVHGSDNLAFAVDPLQCLQQSFCYFARFTDNDNRRVTALKRASQFKAMMGKQNRLVSLVTDTLRTVEVPVFQLNADFDILVDSESVHIIHPAGFRVLGQVDESVAQAIPRNIERIEPLLPYVEWSNIQTYAASHPRAANLIASIRSRNYANNVNRVALLAQCKREGIKLDTSQVKVVVPEDKILDFLDVVDRRRYESNLVKGVREHFRASNRERVNR